MNKKKLTLYIKATCPYCKKVVNFLKDNNMQVEIKNIIHEKHRNHLIKIGGKKQVPCLFIDGKPLYESDEIIQWFKKNT